MADERRMIKRMEHIRDATVQDAVDWCIQRGLDPAQVTLTAAHVKWESPQTDEEKRHSDEWARQTAERTEEWERATYERLATKFAVRSQRERALGVPWAGMESPEMFTRGEEE